MLSEQAMSWFDVDSFRHGSPYVLYLIFSSVIFIQHGDCSGFHAERGWSHIDWRS
jgi:hypothetical protein